MVCAAEQLKTEASKCGVGWLTLSEQRTYATLTRLQGLP